MAFAFDDGLTWQEKVLWMSVLRRAIFDYVLYKGNSQHRLEWQRANQFIFGICDSRMEITFTDICNMFAWDPEYIRKLMGRLTRADVKQFDNTVLLDDNPTFQTLVTKAITQRPKWRIVSSSTPILILTVNQLFLSRPKRKIRPYARWQAAVA